MVGNGGGLGQMRCSCGSFSMKRQWSRTDLENYLLFGYYGITAERTVLELDALGILWRTVEWRRDLEVLGVMITKGCFLARRDTARESSSFCSMV